MLLTVKTVQIETSDCFSLILKKPNNFFFYPGQYLDIELPIRDEDRRGATRAFTIASSPTEDFLMITSTKGISDFKRYFQNLRPKDKIESSHPAGTFILDETEPAIFIAGGVGITPFRSMIKYAVDNSLKTSITLIYSNSNENFLFKCELDEWQNRLPNLKIIYVVTSKEGKLDHQKLETLNSKFIIHNSIFYLAGPPKMVNEFEKILLEIGVDEVNIRYDRFDGY